MNAPLPDDDDSCKGTRDWPHAPPHRLGAAGVYYVTSRTLDRTHYFRGPERLTFVRDHLFTMAAKYHWRLEAWAVLANHYHFVAHSPAGEGTAATLRTMLNNLPWTAATCRRFPAWEACRRGWTPARGADISCSRKFPAAFSAQRLLRAAVASHTSAESGDESPQSRVAAPLTSGRVVRGAYPEKHLAGWTSAR